MIPLYLFVTLLHFQYCVLYEREKLERVHWKVIKMVRGLEIYMRKGWGSWISLMKVKLRGKSVLSYVRDSNRGDRIFWEMLSKTGGNKHCATVPAVSPHNFLPTPSLFVGEVVVGCDGEQKALTLCKHCSVTASCCVINTILAPNPKHSTIWAVMRNVSYISTRFGTVGQILYWSI